MRFINTSELIICTSALNCNAHVIQHIAETAFLKVSYVVHHLFYKCECFHNEKEKRDFIWVSYFGGLLFFYRSQN